MKPGTEPRILVTGGAGFIGSNFLNVMVRKYPTYRFHTIDALTSVASLDNIEVSDAPTYSFSKTDIRDRAALEAQFKEFKPTHVVHFAAESHVDVSIENPGIFIETNVMGTANLLALANAYAIERFHHVSTDEVYGSLGPNDPAFTEHSPIQPNNPYSASKASSDHMVRAYHKTYGLDAVITRCSNNYGPRQDTTKLIPRFIANLLRGESVPLYGNGENIRDWIYVEDHVRALDLVLHGGRAGEVYNIGGNCEIRNIDIAMRLLALTGRDASAITPVADRLGHDFRYAIDSSKIEQELGWKPLVPFDEGIQRTFEFYRSK